jgi:hypothetical protein
MAHVRRASVSTVVDRESRVAAMEAAHTAGGKSRRGSRESPDPFGAYGGRIRHGYSQILICHVTTTSLKRDD